MVISHGTLSTSDRHAASLRQLLGQVEQATRQEAGCLSYMVSESLTQLGHFLITEHWQDMAAMQTHLALPAVGQAIEAVKKLGVSDLTITAYETGQTTKIL